MVESLNPKAEELKTKGNDKFKQGRYTEAIELYSSALGKLLIRFL
jgi:hypothetical protein